MVDRRNISNFYGVLLEKEITVRQRFARFVYPLKLPFLLAALVVAAMTSVPADSRAAGCFRACDYQYYYDAAHTQPSGWCVGACYPGGAYCDGVITEYSVRVACDYCGC